MPQRIQRKRTKGWRMPPNTVCVTRPGVWGNPFQGNDPALCVQLFSGWMLGLHSRSRPDAQQDFCRSNLHELRGKNLACFCALDQPCHADVLLELAQERRMEQIVLVCGGRKYNDRAAMEQVLEAAHMANPIKLLIAGGAPGADTLAEDWARQEATPYRIFHADWDRYGPSAGPLRNQQMLDEGKPDMVIAFPGGPGTDDMIRRAEKAGVPVVRITA